MRKLYVLYIAGLGDRDRNLAWQDKAIKYWKWWGVESELIQMDWGDRRQWPPKLKKITARIDELSAGGKPVALVGVSAGASAVINAYAVRKDKLVGVVCIAGKINRPEKIADYHRGRNPAFVASAHDCAEALKSLAAADRRRIMSRYALFDELVKRPDSNVPGAKNRLLPTVTHAFTIAEQITLGAPNFLRFLKKQAKIK